MLKVREHRRNTTELHITAPRNSKKKLPNKNKKKT